MAETMNIPNQTPSAAGLSHPSNSSGTPRGNKHPSQPRVPLHQVYALPAPIRTFPLPTFNPSNPISLVHLLYEWVRQVIAPPPPEPSVIHKGIWDPNTRSVHIKDAKSIRDLWEQGFFGKGSLSRSEPNWLKREQNRRDATQAQRVSEQHTESRREERRLAKWERAKAELEAIERQRQEEANASNQVLQKEFVTEESTTNGDYEGSKPPVTPEDLLALPNSSAVVEDGQTLVTETTAPRSSSKETIPVLKGTTSPRAPVTPADLLALPNSATPKSVLKRRTIQPNGVAHIPQAPVCPASILALPNSLMDLIAASLVNGETQTNGLVNGIDTRKSAPTTPPKHNELANGDTVNGVNGHADGTLSPTPSLPSNGSTTTGSSQKGAVAPLKRRKSVRFSAHIESTTFQHTDPPSPNRSASTPVRRSASPVIEPDGPVTETGALPPVPPVPSESLSVATPSAAAPVGDLVDKEHFQLAPEEAFFLVFALGALSVVDPDTGAPIPTDHLLTLFRSYSYFPPRELVSPVKALLPSDPFLVQYAVYHHFRSLGWVPRHGIKFGVDFILYQRGPVFDHSEFGLIIIPSFSDPRWKEYEHDEPKRSWSWLMGVNRVLSHVLKSLVLVYVDVPPPPVFDELVRKGGIAQALKTYKIREVLVRRFSVNRNR
ncbi:hypothetical protein V8F20_003482 [Naviculisporaceae sp. PSN 640]